MSCIAELEVASFAVGAAYPTVVVTPLPIAVDRVKTTCEPETATAETVRTVPAVTVNAEVGAVVAFNGSL